MSQNQVLVSADRQNNTVKPWYVIKEKRQGTLLKRIAHVIKKKLARLGIKSKRHISFLSPTRKTVFTRKILKRELNDKSTYPSVENYPTQARKDLNRMSAPHTSGQLKIV